MASFEDDKSTEFVELLAQLADGDVLSRLVVTATVNASGELGPVMGVEEKFEGLFKGDRLLKPRIFGISSKQTDVLSLPDVEDYRQELSRPKLIDCHDIGQMVEKLAIGARHRAGFRPIDFRAVFEQYPLEQFTGRTWLVSLVQNLIANQEQGYILLEAGPGFGKSAFAAFLVDQYQDQPFGEAWLGAWHFLRRTHQDWLFPKTLAAQTEWALRDRLLLPLDATESTVPATDDTASSILTRVLEEAAEAVNGRKLLVIVDGLDEGFGGNAPFDQTHKLRNLFPPRLPKGVFILITARHDPQHRDLEHLNPLCINCDQPGFEEENRLDINGFIDGAVITAGNRHGFALTELHELKNRLANACEGAFFVARWFVDVIGRDEGQFVRWLRHEDAIPEGIDEVLRNDFRQKQHRLTERGYGSLLPVVAAALALWEASDTDVDDVIIDELLDATKWGGDARTMSVGNIEACELRRKGVRACLTQLNDWFAHSSVTSGSYRFRHSRISELLLNSICPGEHRSCVKEVHALLARACAEWEHLSPEVQRIALCNLAWHQAEAGDAEGICTSLGTASSYLQSAYEVLGNSASQALDRAFRSALKLFPTLNVQSERIRRPIGRAQGNVREVSRQLRFVQQTLSRHGALLASGHLPVASALFNDSGGLPSDDLEWLTALKDQADKLGGLLRRNPGIPTMFQRHLVGQKCTALAITPCGRLLAVVVGKKIWLYQFDESAMRPMHCIHSPGSAVSNVAFSSHMDENYILLAWGNTEGHVYGASISNSDEQHVVEEPRLLIGHLNQVLDLVFSPPLEDASCWLASASKDSTIGLVRWNRNAVCTTTQATFISGHTSEVNRLAFSPMFLGGQIWLSSASDDGHVGLTKIGRSSKVGDDDFHLLPITNSEVSCVTFSPIVGDRAWLACGAWNGVVDLLPVDSQQFYIQCRRSLVGHEDKIYDIAFSSVRRDGLVWLATASRDSCVGIAEFGRDGSEDQALQLLKGHRAAVWRLSFMQVPDADTCNLLTASDDTTVGLVALHSDLPSMRAQWTEEGGQKNEKHQSTIRPLIAESVSAEIEHRDQPGRRTIKPPPYVHAAVEIEMACNPSPVYGGVQLLESFDDEINQIAIHPAGDLLITATDNGFGCIGGRAGSSLHSITSGIPGHGKRLSQVQLSPAQNGAQQWLASGSEDGTVGLVIIDPADTHESTWAPIFSDNSEINNLQFSERLSGDVTWLVTTCSDGTIGLIKICRPQLTTGCVSKVDVIKGVGGACFSGATKSGKAWLSLYGKNGECELIPTDETGLQLDQRFRYVHPDSTEQVFDSHFSPLFSNGMLYQASTSYAGTIGLLRVGQDGVDATSLQILRGSGAYYSLSFSPIDFSGFTWLAAGGYDDGFVDLWRIGADGPAPNSCLTLGGHLSGGIWNLAFSHWRSDGRAWLASAGDDCAVGLTALSQNGTAENSVSLMRGHRSPVTRVVFSPAVPGKRQLLASASASEVFLWDAEDRSLIACADFSSTGERIFDIQWSLDATSIRLAVSKWNRPSSVVLSVPGIPDQTTDPACQSRNELRASLI